MKRLINAKKILAIVLALMIALSSLSILSVSAADFDKKSVGKNAQVINSGATIDEVSTGGNPKYNINSSSSWGLRWVTKLDYTNAITKAKETFYANQNVNYHTYNKSGSSTKYTCWCIQPYLCIKNDGNYMEIGKGGNATYWNKFNSKTAIKNAIAKLMAYGKPKMEEKSSNNNQYYFAIQLLAWEFIMGRRGTDENYTMKNNYKRLLSFVKCSSTTKTNDLKNAYEYLLKCLKINESKMPRSLYSSIASAKANRLSSQLKFNYKNGQSLSTTQTASCTLAELNAESCKTLSYSIVNHEGGAPNLDKNFKVSVSGNKITVSTTANLWSLKNQGITYYVKVKRSFGKISKSTSNVILQNTNANSQTIAKSLVHNPTEPVRYYPLCEANIEEKTSVKARKIVSTRSGVEYDGDLSDWVFKFTRDNGAVHYRRTDESGSTDELKDYPLNTKWKVEEVGRIIKDGEDENNYTGVTTITSANLGESINPIQTYKIGFPKSFVKVTSSPQQIICDKAGCYTVEWENKYLGNLDIRITKSVDDDSPVEGYYFYIYKNVTEFGGSVIGKDKIIGPTDSEGNIDFKADYPKDDTLCVLELGFLKSGESLSKREYSLSEFVVSGVQNKFYIPSKYNTQIGEYAITGMNEALPFSIYKSDLKNEFASYEVSNTTSGYLKIHKTDSVTNKPVVNAVYGLYCAKQSSVDPDADNNSSNTNFDNDTGNDTDDGDDDGQEDDEIYQNDDTLICIMRTDKNGEAISPLVPTGTYYLREIFVDSRYVVDNNEYEINITPGSNTLETAIVKELKDNPSQIEFKKTEKSTISSNGKNVAGALIRFYERKEGHTVNFETDKPFYEYRTKSESENLVAVFEIGKTYIAHEAEVPPGYTQADDVVFTVPASGAKQTVTMIDKPTTIKLRKISTDGTDEIPGCHLMVVKKESNVPIDSWISTNEPHIIEGKLVVGTTYTMIETKPADGYSTAESVDFTVKNTPKVQTVTMTDPPTVIEISKRKITGTKELPGCKLEVRDKDDKIIDSWTSTNESHIIKGKLIVGNTYTLVETKPTDGYTTAESIKFKVKDTGEVQTVTMKDKPTKIEVYKTDLTGEKIIPGCNLEIRDSSGKVIDSWISTNKPHLIEGKLVVGKTYTLVETKPVDGYATAESINFTVKDTPDVQKITMKDDTTKIQISKQDITNSKELPGCKLEVRDKNGKVIDSWTSTDKPHLIEGKLIINETYTLVETKPVDGYATAEKISFTVKDTGDVQKVTMKDEPTKIELSKTTITGNDELPGCVLEVRDESGNIIETWTSTDKPHMLVAKLIINKKYTLVELNPVSGYTTAESIEFVVRDTGEVQTVNMKDAPTTIEISKFNITGEKEIPGCKLEVKDKDGNVIDFWTSTEKPHIITGKLIINETYTLSESYPADGYATAKDVSFTVNDTGKVQKVNMKDDTTKIKLSKTTITGNDELSGCKLEVRDENGNVIEAWTSTNKPHLIEGKLIINKTYTLVETKPCDGYITAESIDFVIKDTGEVQTVTMKDAPTKIEISKTDITGEKEIPGCKLEVKDKDGNVVDSWISSNEPHMIEAKLIINETYTLSESYPADGYTTANDITFTVSDTGEVQTVNMKDDTTKVQISKTDLTGTKELPECKLEIKDENGKVIDSWTSTNKPHLIEGKLIINKTYTLVETKPCDGYTTAESVKFTVKDTGEIQKVVMKDAPTIVKIKKVAAHDKKLLLGGAKFKIIDTKTKKVVKKFTTKAGKTFKIKGKLIAGRKYKLVETKAPTGYIKAKAVFFKVKDTAKAQVVKAVNKININIKIPQTGGLNSFINYILVAILITLGLGTAFGGYFYIRKKKNN